MISISIFSGIQVSSKKYAENPTESTFPGLARAGEKYGEAGAINYILLHGMSASDVLEGGTVRRRDIDFGGLDRPTTLAVNRKDSADRKPWSRWLAWVEFCTPGSADILLTCSA